MPQPIAEHIEPAAVVASADVAVDIEVGDVADLGDVEPPLAALQRRAADLQRTEFVGKILELRVGEVLATKHQHRMRVDRLPQRVYGRVGERRCDIEARYFGADVGVEGCYVDGHLASPRSEPSPVALRAPPSPASGRGD
jgi:hypothetical protein